jgi:hypothetical protein
LLARLFRGGGFPLLPAGKLHDAKRDFVPLIIIPIINAHFVAYENTSHGRSQPKLFRNVTIL